MAEEENKKNPNDIATELPVREEFDAAGKSLTDALRISFAILKVIMAVLVVLFITSGIFRVQSDEQAFVLRLGKIRGFGESRILNPGLHWALPEPIDEIIRIPVTKVQTLPIESLWYFQTEREKLGAQRLMPPPYLNPTRDGYCLTRNDSIIGAAGTDYNIVHSKWQLTYKIDYPERFFRNVYYQAPGPGEDFLDVVTETLNPLLETMSVNAIVTTMVNYSIDEAIVSKSDIADDVKNLLQEKLDRINSGITVVAMEVSGKITWPRQVDNAFQASTKARQTKQQRISEARAYADTILGEAGGPNTEQILVALKKAGHSHEKKGTLLMQLAGTCREKIAAARAYRTMAVETAKANADYLQELLPEYRKRPKLVLQKIYQDAIEEVLDNAEEKIFIQPSASSLPRELRVLINRDPTIGKPKQQEK